MAGAVFLPGAFSPAAFFVGAAFLAVVFLAAAFFGATFLAGVSAGGVVSAVRAVPGVKLGPGGGCGAAGEGWVDRFSRGGAGCAAGAGLGQLSGAEKESVLPEGDCHSFRIFAAA